MLGPSPSIEATQRVLERFPLLRLLEMPEPEMRAEVDAEAEEEHQERDGDQVQPADGDRRKPGRSRSSRRRA